MTGNPWMVDNVSYFYFLNCPECAFKTKSKNIFQDHAVENHPLSCVLFENSFESDPITFDLNEPNQILEEIMFPEPDNTTLVSKKEANDKKYKSQSKFDDIPLPQSNEGKPGLYHLCEFCDYESTNEFQFKNHIKAHGSSVLPIAVLTKKVQKPNEINQKLMSSDQTTDHQSENDNNEIDWNKLVKCPIGNCNFETKQKHIRWHMKSKFEIFLVTLMT